MHGAAANIEQQALRRRQRGKGGHRKNKPQRRGGGAGAVFKATTGTGKKRDSRFKRMHEITTRGQEVQG